MMPDREGAGFLLGETARLLRVNPILALAALGAMTAVGVVSHMFADYAPLVASLPSS